MGIPASHPPGARATVPAMAQDFADRARSVAAELAALVAEADRERRFPRAAVERVAAAGLLRERWAQPDRGLGALLAEELGRAGAGSVGLGLTVHAEAALSVLLRYGATPLLEDVARSALDGEVLLAVAATEAAGGSDLGAVETVARAEDDGLRVRGSKSYVSLGACADHVLVTCRMTTGGADRLAPGLAVVLVPRAGVQVERRVATVGVRGTETVRVAIDARVPREAVVAGPGVEGMTALSWGLTHERLATAALTTGTAALAVGLTTAHLMRRRVGGEALFERQAPRLRLGELGAQVDVLRRAVHAVAASPIGDTRGMREVAGLKATVARVCEGVVSDCMHLFGGAGYAEDETPLARLWRDVRAARVGGGTEEMMWSLVAGGLVPADDAYRAMVEGAA